MIIVSLDLAPRASGVTVFSAEDELIYWDTILPPIDLSRPKRIGYSVDVLMAICKAFEVKEAAIEDYAFGAGGTGTDGRGAQRAICRGADLHCRAGAGRGTGYVLCLYPEQRTLSQAAVA